MADSDYDAGPSDCKKIKNHAEQAFTQYLVKEKLEKILYESDDNFEDSISDDDMEEFSSDENAHYCRDDIKIEFQDDVTWEPSTSDFFFEVNVKKEDVVLQPQIDSNDIWRYYSDLKQIPFTRENEFLSTNNKNTSKEFFDLLLDNTFYDLLIEETNRYAEEIFLQKSRTEYSRITKWKPLTTDELKIFLGLFLHMGTIRIGRIKDYWKTDRLFNLRCFSDYMGRDRFLIILKCLHFSRNGKRGDAKPQDRLFKIRPLVDYFNSKMNSVYYPDKNVCIHESMILFRDKLCFRENVRNKSHKYCLKFYMLTEPNGIILKFSVYPGTLDDHHHERHAAKIVLHLMEEKLDVGHSLFMANSYNGFHLSQELLRRSTHSTGSLREGRKGMPESVKNILLERGETIARYSNGVMVGKWRDQENVHYISTEFENELHSHINKRGNKEYKPYPIVQYHKNMETIDWEDQFTNYYPCAINSIKWYKKTGLLVVHLLFLNSFFLYKKYRSLKMTFYEYRLEIIRCLLPDEMQKKTTVIDHYISHCPKGPKGKTLRKKYTTTPDLFSSMKVEEIQHTIGGFCVQSKKINKHKKM